MIRIGTFSEDDALQPLLAEALGAEFSFTTLRSEDEARRRLGASTFDVLLIDLVCGTPALRERVQSAGRLLETGVPAVVLADDALRGAAQDLVRRGAKGFCRRPPAIHTLRTLLTEAALDGGVSAPGPVPERVAGAEQPEDLPLPVRSDRTAEIDGYNPDGAFERMLRDYKIKLAVDAVRDANGNKSLAARSLGISRAYLHRLVRMAGPDAQAEMDRAQDTREVPA